MKILFLCKKFPYPLKDGESIAVSNLCRELKALGCELSLLCFNTRKHFTDPESIPASYNYFNAIHTVDVDNSVRPWQAFASMVSGDSYHIRRFTSEKFRVKLIEILRAEQFDIIQLETLYLAPYVATIRQYTKARVVMRAHNVEHEIWERITRHAGSNIRRLYLAYLTRKLKEYEIGQFPVYDYLVTLTERDLQLFRAHGYVNGASAAPIGISAATYPYKAPVFGPAMSLCFIGSLDWLPNLHGLEWFLRECWPKIHRQWPDITFHIAGRNTPVYLRNLRSANVIVHGEVEDAGKFLQEHAIMVVPLFSGSGMRVKIIEGMLMGKVIITTSLGHEGIDITHQEEVLIADHADQFLDAIRYCLTYPDRADEMGRKAQEKAIDRFDSRKVAMQMLDIYDDLLHYGAHEDAAPIIRAHP